MYEHHSPDLPSMDRRGFLKTGLGGALFLGAVSAGAGLSGCSADPAGHNHAALEGGTPDYTFRFLTGHDIVMLQTLVPAMLGPALSADANSQIIAVNRTIEDFDGAVILFSQGLQDEIRQLFDLLTFAPTRVTIARVWSWESATREDGERFLERWRTSGIGLFNKGYIAMTKITNVAFYGNPDYWQASGYPGPPAWAMDSLPQFSNPPA